MEQKSNDATPLRPQGERILNASLVQMDLNKFIEEIKNEKTWQASGHNAMTLYKSEAMRIVLIGLHKNAELKTHTANGIISVQVIQGKIKFEAEGKTEILAPGQMIALQPNLPHAVLGEEESFFLLTLATVTKK